MEYLKWMLAVLLSLGLLNTGYCKSTLSPTVSANDYEDEAPQDDPNDYNEDDNSENNESVLSNNKMDEPPPYFSQYSIDKTVYQGNDVELHCDAMNLQNNVIIWYNGTMNHIIVTGNSSLNTQKIQLFDGIKIRIRNIDFSDANQYICSVYPQNISKTFNLHVLPARKVAIYSYGRDVTERSMTLREGELVEFECKAIGLKDATIRWSLNGERASNHIPNITDGKIIINSIDHHQSGTYICLGDDGTNNLPQASLQINVQYKPRISTHRHFVNTIPNDDAQLECTYKAEPIAIIEWKKKHPNYNVETITMSSVKHLIKNTVEKGKNRTTLIIRNVNDNDLGEYVCQAKNTIGSSEANIHLSYYPETPLLEKVEIGEKIVKIEWLVRSKSPVNEAAVDYTLNGSHNTWMTESVTSYSPAHTGYWKLTHKLELSPGTWHARMKVRNAYGWSKFSKEHDIHITEDIVESIPPEEIVRGDISRGMIAESSSTSVNNLFTNPLFLFLSCLISYQRLLPLI